LALLFNDKGVRKVVTAHGITLTRGLNLVLFIFTANALL